MQVERIPFSELSSEQLAVWASYLNGQVLRSSPYYRPEFFAGLVQVGRPVEVLLVQDAQGIAGFLPFEMRGGIACPAGGGMNDYQGPILRPGAAPDPLEILRGAGLKRLDYDHLFPADLPGWSRFNTRCAGSPQMVVTGGVDAYQELLRSSGQRNELKTTQRLTRKLGREVGQVRFELDDRDPVLFEKLKEWKSAQYQQTGAHDAFEDEWRGDLLEHYQQSRDPQFRGLMASLYAGEQLVALHYYLQSGTVLHSWFPTYDPAFSKYSPGRVLAVCVIDAAAEQGIELVDMGKGESAYKLRSMTQMVEVGEGVVDTVVWRVPLRRNWVQFKRWLKATAAYDWLRQIKRRLTGGR